MRIDLAQLEFVDERLRDMALDAEKHFRMEFIVTSLYRIDDNGVHGSLPLRGLDFGCGSKLIGDTVVEYINSKWSYDKLRPEKVCCMCHDVGQGLHLHLQVHPNTERRL